MSESIRIITEEFEREREALGVRLLDSNTRRLCRNHVIDGAAEELGERVLDVESDALTANLGVLEAMIRIRRRLSSVDKATRRKLLEAMGVEATAAMVEAFGSDWNCEVAA